MPKTIYFEEEVRKKLLELFEDIKDEYVSKSADGVLAQLDIKDAIENNSLSQDHLSRLKSFDKYEQIMNILRTAHINFDLSKYEG